MIEVKAINSDCEKAGQDALKEAKRSQVKLNETGKKNSYDACLEIGEEIRFVAVGRMTVMGGFGSGKSLGAGKWRYKGRDKDGLAVWENPKGEMRHVA